MSREFLTAIVMYVWYEQLREVAVRAGQMLPREAFVNLPVIPIMKPGAAAQLFAMGAEIVGIQVTGQIQQNRPVAAPNGRNPR
jgi:hypothetical protein